MEINITELNESLKLAEKLARISLCSSRRTKSLFFQQQFEISKESPEQEEKPYVPPKHLLLYLVRMGSFTSRPEMKSKDCHDETVYIPTDLEDKFLLDWVKDQQKGAPPLLRRMYRIAKGRDPTSDNAPFRIMQWNILAQALGTHADNFVSCPPSALDWKSRRFRILEEILFYNPDIICLQEVDHFKFFERALKAQGFEGYFVPKPDSPCIYLPENNGPDGCALFYRSSRFELVELNTKILEVWKVQSNQVAIMAVLRDIISGKEFVVLTTHLKARQGALLASLRHEQGMDLLSFLEEFRQKRPSIVCGDFNAEPNEPVYEVMTNSNPKLSSAYARLNDGEELPYSTWKIRGSGEIKHNIDYIFFTEDQLTVEGGLDMPTEMEIGPERVPSAAYPSDHFSLICDFSFNVHQSFALRMENLRSRQ
ncbi:Nocturnin [Armadillidium nasatum]|uniref:Nocturnin n=1 Tax=Armadillidium nasatum TaxID=96803 RepID=A0A5N5THF5_9CRUS|nr:Nocturnin [Armadillidium nasatum]